MAKSITSSKRSTLANAAATTAAIVAGLVLINVTLGGVDARVDLSSSGFYSLTEASKRLAQAADEPIRVTAYFGKIPEENAYDQQYIESMLDRYAEASGGKLSWTKVDPFERGTEFMAQLKTDKNIDKILWLSNVDGVPQQIPVYFHIHFEYLDKSETWVPPPRFSVEGLEYELSSIIRQLVLPKRKVGVTTGFGSAPQAQAIAAFLREAYDVTPIDLSSPEADVSELDLLIVNGPTAPMGDPQLMLIDNFVLSGKPVLFLMRGYAFQSTGNPQLPPEFQDQQPSIGMPAQSGLDKLLAHYGVRVTPNLVVDPRYNVNGAMPVGGQWQLFNELFPQAEVVAGDKSDPLAGLQIIPLALASTMELTDEVQGDGAIRTQVLVRTSPESFTQDTPLPLTPQTKFARGSKATGPFVAGYALQGTFTSFFAPQGEGQPAPTSPAGTRIIVFGSADFIDDKYMSLAQRHPLFQPLAAGQIVLQNMVDWLASDASLIAARTKRAPPPMEQTTGGERRWIQYGASAGMATFILLLGAVGRLVRERRRRAITL